MSQVLSIFSQQTAILVKKSNQTTTASCNYIVKPGDSLWDIAQMKLGTGFDYTKLKKRTISIPRYYMLDNLSKSVAKF